MFTALDATTIRHVPEQSADTIDRINTIRLH